MASLIFGQTGVVLNNDATEMYIDLSEERKIRILGVDELTGRKKEYFLKVTERKGLVLV